MATNTYKTRTMSNKNTAKRCKITVKRHNYNKGMHKKYYYYNYYYKTKLQLHIEQLQKETKQLQRDTKRLHVGVRYS